AAANGNYSKLQLVELIRKNVPAVEIEYRDVSFGEDMRDVAVSCGNVGRVVGFRARRGVEDGIVEIRDAIESGLIKDPSSAKYRNHQFIVNQGGARESRRDGHLYHRCEWVPGVARGDGAQGAGLPGAVRAAEPRLRTAS